jgi:hypothetical protein
VRRCSHRQQPRPLAAMTREVQNGHQQQQPDPDTDAQLDDPPSWFPLPRFALFDKPKKFVLQSQAPRYGPPSALVA